MESRMRIWGSLWLAGAIWFSPLSAADDWNRFRGPNGSGVAENAGTLPEKWSPTENLQWKIDLPGPGSSSPIVVGDRVFVTCWSGYGESRTGDPGDQKALRRHLICVDRQQGKVLWDKEIEPYLPEDAYRQMFAEHGYASHTPVSDGKMIYVFFGKTGAMAFDLDGKLAWRKQLGTGSDERGWGSACSPILVDDLLICLAAAESKTIYALHKDTGEEVWKQEAGGFAQSWCTPIVVSSPSGQKEIVVGVPNEFWAFDAKSGQLSWYCEGCPDNSYCSSLVADSKGIVYGFEGRGGGGVAVKAGGKDDISKSNTVWRSQATGRISTPLYHEGRIYLVSGGQATCVDAESGKTIYQERLAGGSAANPSNPSRGGDSAGGQPGARGGRGGGRGGMGGQDYSSPVAGDGKLFYVSRGGDMYVLKLGDTFEVLGKNRVTENREDFSGTPAISNGQLFVRSSKSLYCIGTTGKQ